MVERTAVNRQVAGSNPAWGEGNAVQNEKKYIYRKNKSPHDESPTLKRKFSIKKRFQRRPLFVTSTGRKRETKEKPIKYMPFCCFFLKIYLR